MIVTFQLLLRELVSRTRAQIISIGSGESSMMTKSAEFGYVGHMMYGRPIPLNHSNDVHTPDHL